MKYSVPESALEEATSCPYEFSCLETGQCGGHEMCAVDYAIPGNVIFLDTTFPAECPYRWPFGKDRQVCCCPVRGAIWKKYKQ